MRLLKLQDLGTPTWNAILYTVTGIVTVVAVELYLEFLNRMCPMDSILLLNISRSVHRKLEPKEFTTCEHAVLRQSTCKMQNRLVKTSLGIIIIIDEIGHNILVSRYIRHVICMLFI